MDLQRAINLDIKQCLHVLKKHWREMLLALVCGLCIGLGSAFLADEPMDQYTAVASVYSFQEGSFDSSAQGRNALFTYSDTIKSYAMAEKIREKLAVDWISTDAIYYMLRVDDRIIQGTTYIYETQASVLKIYVDCPYDLVAIEIANAAADLYVEQINQLFSEDYLKVLDYANTATQTVNGEKQYPLYAVIGSVGLLTVYLCCLIASVLFSNKIVTIREAGLYGTLDVIGAIPVYNVPKKGKKAAAASVEAGLS